MFYFYFYLTIFLYLLGSQSDGSGTEEELSLYNKPETPFNISNQRKTPILQSPSSLQTGNPSPTGL